MAPVIGFISLTLEYNSINNFNPGLLGVNTATLYLQAVSDWYQQDGVHLVVYRTRSGAKNLDQDNPSDY